MSIDLDELTAADDYHWFAARPNRILRLRHATEGDTIGVGPDRAVIAFCPAFAIRLRPGFVMQPEVFNALMTQDTDAALAPYFAGYLDNVVAEQGRGPSVARRWKRLFQIVREHGRLSALPSREALDQPYAPTMNLCAERQTGT